MKATTIEQAAVCATGDRLTYDNDAERARQNYELEAAAIASEERQRNAERDMELQKYKLDLTHNERNESRAFYFVASITGVVCALIGVLIWRELYAIAAPLITGVLGIGTGWQGGKSAGYRQARREIERTGKEQGGYLCGGCGRHFAMRSVNVHIYAARRRVEHASVRVDRSAS